MALDQLITVDPYGIKLTPALVKLNLDKKIYLLHIFANDEVAKKKFKEYEKKYWEVEEIAKKLGVEAEKSPYN